MVTSVAPFQAQTAPLGDDRLRFPARDRPSLPPMDVGQLMNATLAGPAEQRGTSGCFVDWQLGLSQESTPS